MGAASTPFVRQDNRQQEARLLNPSLQGTHARPSLDPPRHLPHGSRLLTVYCSYFILSHYSRVHLRFSTLRQPKFTRDSRLDHISDHVPIDHLFVGLFWDSCTRWY